MNCSRMVCPGVGFLVLLTGCSSQTALHPVRGKVLVNGRPAQGAVVVFHPASTAAADAPRPAARVEADGTFALSTFVPGDGAPAGDYVVAISWVARPPATAALTRANAPPIGKLDPTYADPRRTPLRAQIAAGANEIPTFTLRK